MELRCENDNSSCKLGPVKLYGTNTTAGHGFVVLSLIGSTWKVEILVNITLLPCPGGFEESPIGEGTV